jgi:hypothetical protein
MKNLLLLLPPIKRARGCRLYTENSRGRPSRFVDLWLDGGKALLGHRPPSVLLKIKNTADRGLFVPYPSCETHRFEKALKKILPARNFFVLEQISERGEGRLETGKDAPLARAFERGKYYEGWEDEPVIQPVLPHPLSPKIIAIKNEADEPAADEPAAPILLPPVILAATTRALWDLLASETRGEVANKRLLELFESAAFKKKWRRAGIYLYRAQKAGPEEWESIFIRFLENGFLLPPCAEEPLVLPEELSDGEAAALVRLLGDEVS